MADSFPLPARAEALRALLQAAGHAALEHFGRGDPRRKPDGTLLTDADLAAEAVLLAGLAATWPTDTLISEEGGTTGGPGPARWVVDPLDGTSSFTEGLAHWGPTVARIVPGRAGESVELGALYLPRLAEHFHVEGGVAWMNGVRMPPLAARRPPRVVYLPSAFHRHLDVDFAGKARCLGGTAAHLALVARGSAAFAIVAPGWSVWDAAAGLAMIEAVGGCALRFPDGAPLDPLRDTGFAFVAGEAETVRGIQIGRAHV